MQSIRWSIKIKKIRHNIQYILWGFSSNKLLIKKRAQIAQNRGDQKVSLKLWNRFNNYFPNNPDFLLARNFLLNSEFPDHNDISNIQLLLASKLYNEALESFVKVYRKKPEFTHQLYLLGGELLKQWVSSEMQCSKIELEEDLVKCLCYQNPLTYHVQISSGYPVICNILFVSMSNKQIYNQLIAYLDYFLSKKNLVNPLYNISSGCLFLAFNFAKPDLKKLIATTFFDDFITYNQWSMILMVTLPVETLEQNIKIFNDLLLQQTGDIRNKNSEDLFKYLYLSSVTNPNIREKLILDIKKINQKTFEAKRMGCLRDLEYTSGRKDFYENFLQSTNLKDWAQNNVNFNISKDKLKIAVCISGQLRGYKKAFKSWDRFASDGHNITYFVHSWNKIGRKYPDIGGCCRSFSGKFIDAWIAAWLRLGESDMKKKYKNVFSLFSEEDFVRENDLKDFYGTNNVVLEDDNSFDFKEFSNPQKMYYKVYECHQMIVKSKQEFDLVIRIRPDKELLIDKNKIDWMNVYKQTQNQNLIIVDSGPYLYPNFEYVIGDQVAIGSPKIINRYAATYNFRNFIKKSGFDYYPKDYHAHLDFSYSTLYQGIGIESMENFGIKNGNLLDIEPLDPMEVFIALKKDIENSVDKIDLSLIGAIEYDLINKVV